jgi:hypothetical protein
MFSELRKFITAVVWELKFSMSSLILLFLSPVELLSSDFLTQIFATGGGIKFAWLGGFQLNSPSASIVCNIARLQN